MKMRSCKICGKTISDRTQAFRSMKRNLLWLMSLSLAGQLNKECARALADSITQKRPPVCHVHLVHAAQYMLAEILVAGKQISHFKDPKASGHTAYVSNGDIPEGLVSALNRMLEGSFYVTSRDVSEFLNVTLKRYYSTAMWPVAAEAGADDVTEMKENGEDFASTKKGLEPEAGVEKPCPVYAAVGVPVQSKDDLTPDDISECFSTRKSAQKAKPRLINRSCAICGKKLAAKNLKSWARKKSQNMIMLFSLSLAGQIQPKCARRIAESLTKAQVVCHVHIVQAAKYMLTELVAAGNKISHFQDPSASGSTAYVTNGDIPQDLISVLNSMAKGGVSITARDVSKFLNIAFKLYYSTALWPVTEQVLEEDVVQLDQDEMPGISEANVGLSTEGDNTETTCTISVKNQDDLVFDDLAEYSSTSESFQEMDQTQQMDQTALEKYFLVSGEMLMNLFRFCPQCGRKLDAVRLTVAGTAAVVKFTCERCCINPPHEERWESQKRTVPHTKERAYKGNMASSIAAINTGLPYIKLERWSEQLGFASFSRCFFEKLSDSMNRTSM